MPSHQHNDPGHPLTPRPHERAGRAPAYSTGHLHSADGPMRPSGAGVRERLRAVTWSAADTAHFMDIREMTPADLPLTAFWHRTALPQAFFTRLGPRFLRRWQQTYLDSPHAIALVAERTDVLPPQPVAFLLAATDAQAHQAHVLRHHRLSLTVLGLGALLVRPAVLVRFLRTRAGRYIQRMAHLPTTGGLASQASPTATDAACGCPPPTSTSSTDPAQAHRARVAVVVALVVDVKVRRSGVGRALLDAFTLRAAQAGADRAELVTAWASDAEAFYDECGWSRSTMRPNRDGSFVSPFHLALGAEVPPAECARHAAGPVATSSD